MIEEEVFKRYRPDVERLLAFGFIEDNGRFTYTKEAHEMTYHVIVDGQKVTGQVLDEFGEDYSVFRLRRKLGTFAADIKADYTAFLETIRDQCFNRVPFIADQTNRIVSQIKEVLGDDPEHLFEKNQDIAVFRHGSQKWYAIIMVVEKKKLEGCTGDEEVEVMNVKLPEERVATLIEQEGYYRCYHMNKKKWLTIILDDTLDDETIMDLIKTSYILTSGHKLNRNHHEWIVPANPRYYDIVGAFKEADDILWKQSSDIQVGDIVYMYVGAPYSSLMYKTKAIQVRIPYEYEDQNVRMKYLMRLIRLESYAPHLYPLKLLATYGVKTVRGPRYMPIELSKALNQ